MTSFIVKVRLEVSFSFLMSFRKLKLLILSRGKIPSLFFLSFLNSFVNNYNYFNYFF